MPVIQIVLAILLFISAIFLIVAVLMQTGKSKGVGSAIGGGSSETYFGKNKSKSKEKKLALLTTIVAIIFAALALVSFVIQPYEDLANTTTTPSTNASTSSSNAVVDSSTAGSTDTSVSGSTDSSTDASAGATDSAVESTTDSSEE